MDAKSVDKFMMVCLDFLSNIDNEQVTYFIQFLLVCNPSYLLTKY